MAEIRTIHGGRVPGTPSESVIETLEMLLARARAGELIAFAYATADENSSFSTGWDGESGTRNTLGMAIMVLQHRFAEASITKEDVIDGP